MPRCACGTYFSADSETEDEEDEWETPWLKQWAEENQKFVKTKACRLVESKLHLNRIVLVGEAGCGKSAIAKNIALKYMALKWKIVDVKSLNDIKNAPVKTKSVLFVVNDPIGKSDIDEKLFRLWHLQKEMLDDYSRKNKEGDNKVKLPKVIVTCRSNLLENDREFIMSGFTIINLDKDEARLTQKEKEYILKRHIDCSELENNELNQILLTDKSFPLLSSIVSTSKTLQENILKFFSEPFDQLNREILLLRENSKEKYLCLLLLILHGNKLSKHSFHDETEDRESLEYMNDEKEDDDDNNDDDEDEDDDNKDEDDDDDDDDDDEDDDDDDDDDENDCEIIDEKMLNDLFETLNLRKGISRIAIFQCLKSLRGHYFLRCVRRIFKITNNSFLRALTNIFCNDVPEQFLKYCQSSFFSTSTTCSVPRNEIFPKIQLVDRFIDSFVDRIEEDIKNGTYLDIFLCPWILDDRVLTKLLMRLKTKPFEEMEKLTLYSKLNQDNDLQIPGPLLQKKLQGYSRLDLIPRCHEISPIILMLVLNIDKLFSAIFSLVKENRSCSEYFRNAPLMSACSVNGRKEFAEQVLEITECKNACWSKQENIYSIHVAANFLHADILSLILNEECDVNMLTQNNESPLFLAATAGKYTLQNISWTCNLKFSDPSKTFDELLEDKRLQTLILLVRKGADVNIHPVTLPTALAFTCQRQNVDIVRFLLDNGANVNETGDEKLSPLHFASKVGNLEIVQLLLDKGADVHMRSNGGLTPLYFASLSGYDAVVELFLKRGTYDELKEETGYTPFFVACKHGHTNIVKMFLQHDPCVNCTVASGTSAVSIAVRNGHDKIVDMLLKHGADVNIVQKTTMIGPLYSAASRGYVSIVEILLNCGLDINLKTKKGDTPLLVASKNGQYSTVHFLLKNKANVNQANDLKRTPLHFAAEQGHLDIVSLLLENKADVDACAKSGGTPLILASGCGHEDVVQELLNHDADVNMSNGMGATALFVASEHGHAQVVKILAKKADVNLCTKNKRSPLFIASEFGHHEIVQELLCHGSKVNGAGSKNPLLVSSYSGHEKTVALLVENGAKINECDDEGNSALMNASRRGWINVVKILLKNNADVDICDDDDDQNALSMACFRGHSDIVKLLLDHGMDINNDGDDENYTPLQRSLEGNRLSTALLLLDRGADVNTIVDGSTAVSLACSAGLKEVVDILLERKADVNPKQPDGSPAGSPLLAAVKEGHFQIVKVLLQHGADTNYTSGYATETVLMKAVQKNHPGIVKLLLENGANVNAKDNFGNTALHTSAYCNSNADSLSILLKYNADVNVCNQEGTTPLMMALDKFNASLKFIQALVDHGADVNARDNDGQLILHFAAGCSNGQKCIPLLLKHGADVNARNENGETALHEASYVGSYKAVKVLLRHGANGTLRSKAGLSPLHIAKREGREKVVRILSERFGESDIDKEVVLARNNPLGPALPRKRSSLKLKKTWR